MSVQIDPRASVDPKAVIGQGVTIGPFTIIEEDVFIGDRCTIASNVLLASGARIGAECRVYHGAIIGYDPQDLKYAGEKTTCEVGDRTIVREYASLHRGTGEGGRTVIGSDVLLMGFVHIGHDSVVGNHAILANAATLGGHCEVGDHAIIGGLTPVHQFVHIGAHSMIGGGFRTVKDVPPYVLAGQVPLIFQGLNSVGLRRRGFPANVIQALEKTYMLIYRSGLNVSQAIGKITVDPTLSGVAEVKTVLDFIARSHRGILGGPRLAKS
jgi:UDP-N-acetylglucosamine acyltransferase